MVDRRVRGWLVSCGFGAALVLAELVPGASAASLAIVLGGYGPLLARIGRERVAPSGAPSWLRSGAVSVGVLLVIVLSLQLSAALDTSLLPRAFWFGFLLVAVPLVGVRVQRWDFQEIVLLVLGSLIGMALARLELVQLDPAPLSAFVGALISGVALLLPGGFGSAVLRASDAGIHVSAAFHRGDGVLVVAFVIGLALGVTLAAKLIWRALQRFPDATLAVLLGMLCSGLPRVWPWQRIDAYTLTVGGDAAAVTTTPLWPAQYVQATGADPHSAFVIAVMLVAGAAALGCRRVMSRATDAAASM